MQSEEDLVSLGDYESARFDQNVVSWMQVRSTIYSEVKFGRVTLTKDCLFHNDVVRTRQPRCRQVRLKTFANLAHHNYIRVREPTGIFCRQAVAIDHNQACRQ